MWRKNLEILNNWINVIIIEKLAKHDKSWLDEAFLLQLIQGIFFPIFQLWPFWLRSMTVAGSIKLHHPLCLYFSIYKRTSLSNIHHFPPGSLVFWTAVLFIETTEPWSQEAVQEIRLFNLSCQKSASNSIKDLFTQ